MKYEDKYILDEHTGKPVKCNDLLKWGKWFQEAGVSRVIKREELDSGVQISTVFLGLDHSFGHGKPILFETMVFGGINDQYMERYGSKTQALKGHRRIAKMNTKEALAFKKLSQ